LKNHTCPLNNLSNKKSKPIPETYRHETMNASIAQKGSVPELWIDFFLFFPHIPQ